MIFALLLILSLIGTYWTYKDAANRGMNARLWALFMLLSSMLGLPIYLMARGAKQSV